jgi:hypothetical protein
MFIPNLKQDENEIGRLLRQNSELESLATSLLQLFQGNKLHFCDFLYFAFINRLYPEEITLSLKAIYLRTAHEVGLNKYIHALWIVEQDQTLPATVLLFSAFTKSPKFLEIFKLKTDNIRKWLETLIPNSKQEELIQQIKTSISSLPASGPEPCILSLIVSDGINGYQRVVEDLLDPDHVCQRIKTLSSTVELSFLLDFPIPLPFEVPIESEELLTPFPLTLEAPLINPCLRFGPLIKDLLGSLPKLSEEELGVM